MPIPVAAGVVLAHAPKEPRRVLRLLGSVAAQCLLLLLLLTIADVDDNGNGNDGDNV